MPSWKKIIVSGSNAELNQITSSAGINAVGPFTFQTTAAANDTVFRTAGTSGRPLILKNSNDSAKIDFQTNGDVVNVLMSNNSKNNLLKLSADGLTETRGQVGSAHADGNLELYSNNGLNNLILSASMTTISGSGDTTLDVKGNILSEGNISGSAASTGSFGHLLVNGSAVGGSSPDATDGSQDTISGSAASTGSFGILEINGGQIASDGNDFGIGTSTPTSPGGFAKTFEVSTPNDGASVVLTSGDNGVFELGALQNGRAIIQNRDTTQNGYIQISTGTTRRMLITNDGDVNISSTLYATGNNAKLYVDGKVLVDGNLEATGSISGSLTSTGSFGHLVLGNRDTDASFEFGRAHVGHIGYSDMAGFSHVDLDATTTFALAQNSSGKTIVNAASGQQIALKVNNADVASVTATGLGVGTDEPEHKLHVVGDGFFTGDITAQNFIVSSSVTSITYQSLSGSTIFGDTADDTHQFTGSLLVTGSNLTIDSVGTVSGSSISTGSFGVVESAGDVIARNKAGAYITGPTNQIDLYINTGQRHFHSSAATGGVAAGAGASVTGDGVSIGYLTTAGGGSSVAIGRGLTTTANQVRIGESGVTDAYLGQGNATLHIGAINSSGNISGSSTSTGSFGKLAVGSATIQIPSNGFITMGSEEGMVKNTRFGVNAGRNLQSGGTQNVLIGEEAGAALTTGDKNVVVGLEALKTETGGQNNTAIGYRALKTLNQNSVGGNIALGLGAGEDLATGAFNIVIGYGADTQATDDTRSIVIGSEDTVGLGDNTTVIGGASQTLVAFGGDALISGSAASTGSFGAVSINTSDLTGGGRENTFRVNGTSYFDSSIRVGNQTEVGTNGQFKNNNGAVSLYSSFAGFNVIEYGSGGAKIRGRVARGESYNGVQFVQGDVLFTSGSQLISGSSTSTASFGHLMVGGGNFTSASLASAVAGSGGGGSGISNVVEDSSPQLGGDLDLNSNDITGTGNINIAGNLTVLGTTSTISTTNIKIGDSFGFFATGSAGTNVDGGIIIQSGSAVDSGSAMYHDISTERWSVAKGIASTATTVTDSEWQGYVATVFTSSGSPVGESPKYGVGEIHIDENGDIFIYS